MIGKLKGLVDSAGEDWALIDVGGVCYQVHCSSRTLGQLPQVGEAVALSIETYVREDQIKLFGFLTGLERDWFRLLQSVQGVGAKVALAILSALTTEELASAVVFQDKTAVGRASGVGPKLALRIVNELKNKAPQGGVVIEGGKNAGSAAAPTSAGIGHDAVSALVNLGYAPPQAASAVAQAMARAGRDAGLDLLIREGLKELAS
ncbi:MAG: Holliday junction branch migration protein RuvA [Alphaproteobacteria bacterium]|nr:MAG: Holliday junction branch migration protein RuvA [Alphaproteobacteria bacterium]